MSTTVTGRLTRLTSKSSCRQISSAKGVRITPSGPTVTDGRLPLYHGALALLRSSALGCQRRPCHRVGPLQRCRLLWWRTTGKGSQYFLVPARFEPNDCGQHYNCQHTSTKCYHHRCVCAGSASDWFVMLHAFASSHTKNRKRVETPCTRLDLQ